jgi:hypothetical protein
MTNNFNPIRPDDYRFGTPMRGSGLRRGLILGLAAVVVVIGLIFFNAGREPMTTASYDRPAATQSGPAGSQPPADAPGTTPAPNSKQ